MAKEIYQRTEPLGGLDFYATPEWVTESFLVHVLTRFPHWADGNVWEPACGNGAMAEVLKPHFPQVYSSDIVYRGYKFIDSIKDVFTCDPPVFHTPHCPYAIITNPPFCVAEKFMLRALSVTPRVAVLGRLSWLEGISRYEHIYRHRSPSEVHVFVRRIKFLKNGNTTEIEQVSPTPHAWYIWDDVTGVTADVHPTIHWIP